jgi:transcriptional regulator with XRE-family HTH domain
MATTTPRTPSLAEQLRSLRGARSLRELSEQTKAADEHGRGLSFAYLSKLERGAVRAAPAAIELIARTFGVDPDDFLEYRLHTARLMLDESHAGLENAEDALRRLDPLSVA